MHRTDIQKLDDGFTEGTAISGETQPLNQPVEPEPVEEDLPWKSIRSKHYKLQVKNTTRRQSLFHVFALKFFRLLCFGFCFGLILGTSVLSKLVLTLMSAHTVQNRTMDVCVEVVHKTFQISMSPFERMSWIWSIWFVLIIPEVLVFLDSFWICVFKRASLPSFKTFCVVFLGETLHTVGLCLLIFEVLPSLDSIRSVMLMNGLCLVPACLTMLSRDPRDNHFRLKLSADIVCLVGIMAGIILWSQSERMYILPLAGILVSCNWWENFVSEDSKVEFVKTLAKYSTKLKENNRRNFAYLFVSLWKIVVCFLSFIVYLIIHSTRGEQLLDYLSYFSTGFRDQPVQLIQVWHTTSEILSGSPGQSLTSVGLLPLYLLLFQAGCSLLCYWVSIFSCRIGIQEFSFSFSLMISTPIALFLSSSACFWRDEDVCFLTNVFPEYVFWNCPPPDFLATFMTLKYGWIWGFWFLSQIWFTAHIWTPMRNTETLFMLPLYNGVIVEQSLITNRVQEKQRRDKSASSEPLDPIEERNLYDTNNTGIRTNTIIYGCATMWHETMDEMKDMMKSIMRMDDKLLQQRIKRRLHPESKRKFDFVFETHIFFDDAFAINKLMDGEVVIEKRRRVNEHVKNLFIAKKEAEEVIYGNKKVKFGKKPLVYVTPYGGRLIWTLPGDSLVYVHLKDKKQIKVKKRWSQVMYMFYLLGYKLLDKKTEVHKPNAEDNTFILALDGDMDFQPDAVQALLDLMEKNSHLAAACGRIHPVGQGLMAWYQRFEYAIGHWLQKATEHVIGCVLCSPGCFSLFRARMLLQVMETYSKNAIKPIEHVQFDLGEDRWLCTLILKKGYAIEYSAASDAYTRVPESFNEFYNQRRRWGPSTMANIIDILTGWSDTVKQNKNISTIYIMYTLVIMVGTILGPGTIFLMITGAISAAFQVSNITALWVNLLPITVFIFICFFTGEKIQLLFAGILSTLFALLMMAVLVGTIIQLKDDGISSPSGIFLISLAASFIIAALLHPLEFYCLKHGILYFLLVPSMYLLLTLYALINMNVIAWGTREDKKKPKEVDSDDEDEDEQKKNKKVESSPEENQNQTKDTKNEGYFANFTNFFDAKNKDSAVSKFCSCFLCTYDKEDEATHKLLQKVEFIVEDTRNKMTHLERFAVPSRSMMSPGVMREKLFIPPSSKASSSLETLQENEYATTEEIMEHPAFTNNPEEEKKKEEEKKEEEKKKEERKKLKQARKKEKNEQWTKTNLFLEHSVNNLEQTDKRENTFWVQMMERYLTPDKKPTEEQRKKGIEELVDMRNNYIFAFFMLNGLFILVVFLLQINKDELYFTWPVNAKTNVTYIPTSSAIQIDYDYLHLEPFGFVFAIFFGLILLMQFIAMLVHRFETFIHLMGNETLSCKVNHTIEFENKGHKESQANVNYDQLDEVPKSGDPEIATPTLLQGHRKSIAPAMARDPNARRPTLFYQQKEEEEPAERLEDSYINDIQNQANAVKIKLSRGISQKLNKQERFLSRRLSKNPAYLDRLKSNDDTGSLYLSRSNSISSNAESSVARTESNLSTQSNRMFQQNPRAISRDSSLQARNTNRLPPIGDNDNKSSSAPKQVYAEFNNDAFDGEEV